MFYKLQLCCLDTRWPAWLNEQSHLLESQTDFCRVSRAVCEFGGQVFILPAGTFDSQKADFWHLWMSQDLNV